MTENKIIWILSNIEAMFWTIFIMVGGYVLFVTSIKPTYKYIIVGLLAMVLYSLNFYISKKIEKRKSD
jgi:uncharacterized membrane protein